MKKLVISLLVAGSLVLPAAYAADTKMKGQETTTAETMHTETETMSEKGHHANHHKKHRAHHNKHHGKKHHAKKHQRHHTSERCGGPRCDGSARCR